MPDKLTKQTVYVPVPVTSRLPAKNEMVVTIHKSGGIFIMQGGILHYTRQGVTHWLEKQEGAYPLTGKELADLLTEYEESLHGNSTSFLKEKGVEI